VKLHDRERLLAGVSQIATLAAARILKWYKKGDVGERQKADHSPVTEADLAAHQTIVHELARLTPGVPILSEESADDPASQALPATAPVYWCVDPLDGTRDFLSATDEFTVNIALVENAVPTLGVIQAPVTGAVWAGAVGIGTTKNGKVVHARKLDVSRLHVLVSRFHRQGEVEELGARFPTSTVTPVGSSLKYALIAEGTADMAWRRGETKLWDTAAANALLTAAGGAMRTFDGSALAYDGRGLVHPGFVALGDATADWSLFIRDAGSPRR